MAKGRSLPTGQRRRFDPETREPLARERQHGVDHIYGVYGVSAFSAIVATSDPALIAQYHEELRIALAMPDAEWKEIQKAQ